MHVSRALYLFPAPHTQHTPQRIQPQVQVCVCVVLTKEIMQGLLLIAFLPAARSMEVDIAAPPALTVRNEIDAEGYFNVTMSGGAECMCEEPACAGNQLEFNDFATFRAKERCNSYAVGGSITTHGDGTVCYTFRADYKSCVVYPSDAYTSGFTTAGAAACSRLVGASCKLSRSVEPGGQWKEYP